MRIPRCGLDLSMSQQPADHGQALPEGQSPARIRVPEVMDSNILQPSPRPKPQPRIVELAHTGPRPFAANHPRNSRSAGYAFENLHGLGRKRHRPRARLRIAKPQLARIKVDVNPISARESPPCGNPSASAGVAPLLRTPKHRHRGAPLSAFSSTRPSRSYSASVRNPFPASCRIPCDESPGICPLDRKPPALGHDEHVRQHLHRHCSPSSAIQPDPRETPTACSRPTAATGSLPSTGSTCRSSRDRKVLSVFGLQRTATCSAMYRAARSATFGPFASFAAIGSGTGSSPALMRAMMSAARRRACSVPITPWRPTVTRFAPSGPRA